MSQLINETIINLRLLLVVLNVKWIEWKSDIYLWITGTTYDDDDDDDDDDKLFL